MLALLRTRFRKVRSYGLPKDVARDGGEGQAAVVIRWPKGVPVRGDTTLARKVSGAGRIKVMGRVYQARLGQAELGWVLDCDLSSDRR